MVRPLEKLLAKTRRIHRLGAVWLLSLCVPLGAMAQKSFFTPSKIWVGASAGMSGSFLLFSPYVPQSVYWGYYAGGEFFHSNQKYTGIRVQLGMAARGTQDFPSPDSQKSPHRKDLGVVEAALLCHLYYPWSRVDVGLDLGPVLGGLVYCKTSGETDDKEPHQTELVKNKFSWGIKAGPVVLVHFKKHVVAFSAHGYYGLSNLYGSSLADPFGRSGEVAVTLSLSYLFGLK